jgi:catechol 2,3-dioxygenase-like lactoylglutathione lyase family enzyme
MSSNEGRTNDAATGVATAETKLEVVIIPVSGVDRAKEFYSRLGWRLDADRSVGNGFRLTRFRKLDPLFAILIGTFQGSKSCQAPKTVENPTNHTDRPLTTHQKPAH